MAVGYSGTPLEKKLGIKAGFVVKYVNKPDHYEALFTIVPGKLNEVQDAGVKKDFIHFFTKEKGELIALLPGLKEELLPNGAVWVSWPKKSSKVTTSISETDIRNYALSIGLVDIKVCAVDETWSGLKLVIPVKSRVGNKL